MKYTSLFIAIILLAIQTHVSASQNMSANIRQALSSKEVDAADGLTMLGALQATNQQRLSLEISELAKQAKTSGLLDELTKGCKPLAITFRHCDETLQLMHRKLEAQERKLQKKSTDSKLTETELAKYINKSKKTIDAYKNQIAKYERLEHERPRRITETLKPLLDKADQRIRPILLERILRTFHNSTPKRHATDKENEIVSTKKLKTHNQKDT